MRQEPLSFDDFVGKIVRHNKLATESQILEATAACASIPQGALLDQLIARGVLHDRQEKQIRLRFETWQQQFQAEVKAVSAPWVDVAAGGLPTTEAVGKPSLLPSASELLGSLIDKAHVAGASDLHLSPGMLPMIRLHGRLEPLPGEAMTKQTVETLLFSVLNEKEEATCRQRGAMDGGAVLAGHRLRYTLVQSCMGWDGIFRLVPDKPRLLADLNLPDVVERLTAYREGLVLITGPSGSGKSTTLSALIDHINRSRDEHIITLEDPIETVLCMKKSQISQRAIGRHTASFGRALRAALRQDPDVIVVGELRDRETTTLAVSAAETGHLVFATLHTTSAPQTLNRLLDFFPPDQRNQVRAMISESLRGVLCQRLVPRIDGDGCVLAVEIMLNVPAIANVIREDRIYQLPNTIQLNKMHGMQLLDEELQALHKQGVISGEEAYYAANNRQVFAAFAPSTGGKGGAHGTD